MVRRSRNSFLSARQRQRLGRKLIEDYGSVGSAPTGLTYKCDEYFEAYVHEFCHAAVSGIAFTARRTLSERITKWHNARGDQVSDLFECKTLAVERTVLRILGIRLNFDGLLDEAVRMNMRIMKQPEVCAAIDKSRVRGKAQRVVNWIMREARRLGVV